MLEYFSQISEIMKNYPMVVAGISNLILGCVFLLSFWIPQKVVARDLRKIQKGIPSGTFDKLVVSKLMVVGGGVLMALLFSVIGLMLASSVIKCPGSVHLVSTVVIFSVVSVFSKLLADSDLVDKSKLPSHFMMYRISSVSFLVAAAFSVLSVKFPNYIAHGFSLLIFVYYLAELYSERRTLDKCFVLIGEKESSLIVPFVESVNKRFAFISMIGMVAVLWLHYQREVPSDVVLYRNILGMYGVFIGMFSVQALVTAVVNRFLARLGDLGKSKISKKSLKQRRKNWMWLCDMSVIICYATALFFGLILFGVNVMEYIVIDKAMAIGLVVFGTFVLYSAFGEFSDAYVDRSSPADRDKVLTFMPIVKVMLNVLLFFTSGLVILSLLGVAIGPFLASFAAVGVAVGLAAQDLVKGFLHGIILLIENNFYMGDYVTINGLGGIVVKISTRTLTLRDFNGDEYTIPYNTIGVITNHSRDFFVHFESLLVSPHADVKKAGELLTKVVDQMRSEPEYADKILGDVNVSGIKTFSDEGLHICWNLKTTTAGRLLHLEIYKRLLPLLREAGIPVPYKQEYTEHLLTVEA
jgi:small-conductance mechanosensitive channel